MLHLYRRHLKACSHRSMTYRRCTCPMWMFGSVDGKRVRQALDTTSWKRAEEILREREGENLDRVKIEAACERFEKDCEARQLGEAQLGKYKLLTKELKAAFPGRGVAGITVDELRAFREGWKLAPITAAKKLERLRTFFRFCHDSGWIGKNPARVLKAPKAKALPTLPFTKDEIEKMEWAVDLFPTTGIHKNQRERIRAFLLALRFTGLRISDATALSREQIEDGKVILYPQKTPTPVYLPLPKQLLVALAKIEDGSRYYFWTGYGGRKSAVSVWQRTLANLFKKAGIRNGHAHRFRDTFSVNLLQSGVSLETVSRLLGHSSVKITEKHYAPWVKSRQVALEAEIGKAWKLA